MEADNNVEKQMSISDAEAYFTGFLCPGERIKMVYRFNKSISQEDDGIEGCMVCLTSRRLFFVDVLSYAGK